jgi:hypothetical protein
LPKRFLRLGDHRVRGIEQRQRRTIVLLQRDAPRRRIEQRRKIEDVAHRGAPEAVDRLRIVADHRQSATVRLDCQQDARLQRVGVLVFIDQHMREARTEFARDHGLGRHLRPVQKQVVVIEHLLRLFRIDVGAEQQLQIVFPLGAPGEGRLQHIGQRSLRVDRRRIDRQAGALQRKAFRLRRQTDFVAHEIHQIGRVLAIMDRECRIEPDARGVLAQQPCPHTMERTGPPKPPLAIVAKRGDTCATIRCTRRVISSAARREKVSSINDSGSAPFTSRCATRCASVPVFPVPAPAITSSGPATSPAAMP